MKCLFVGGSADGQWIEVPDDQRYWYVAAPHDIPPAPEFAETLHPPPQQYQAQPWQSAGHERVWIFVLAGVTNALERLLVGYRPGEAIQADLDSDSYGVTGVSEKDKRRRLEHYCRTGRTAVTIILPPKETLR